MSSASWITNRPHLSPFPRKTGLAYWIIRLATARTFRRLRQGREHFAGSLDFNLESAVFVLHSLAHGLENRQAIASRVFGSVYGFWLAFF